MDTRPQHVPRMQRTSLNRQIRQNERIRRPIQPIGKIQILDGQCCRNRRIQFLARIGLDPRKTDKCEGIRPCANLILRDNRCLCVRGRKRFLNNVIQILDKLQELIQGHRVCALHNGVRTSGWVYPRSRSRSSSRYRNRTQRLSIVNRLIAILKSKKR